MRRARWFQSTPAIAGGRDCRPPRAMPACWSFNPRPPLLAGETLNVLRGANEGGFQSTPAIAGGRDDMRDAIALDICVSIHARHCWRARQVWGGPMSNAEMFQSTPAIAGGRDAAGLMRERAGQVSIHARHCWRARPGNLQGPAGAVVFQSTPAIAGGRDKGVVDARGKGEKFQSTPAIAGGRDHCWRQATMTMTGFNPRPPLLAGETVRAQLVVTERKFPAHARTPSPRSAGERRYID